MTKLTESKHKGGHGPTRHRGDPPPPPRPASPPPKGASAKSPREERLEQTQEAPDDEG